MEYLDFLEDEDHDRLKVLMTLQSYNDQYLTQKRLIELTGLSKFLLEKYLKELNQDCPELGLSDELYDELTYHPISNDTIQKTQHIYAQRSLKFRFFIEVLIEEKTLNKFQEEQHIAKTTLYQIRTKVLNCLKQEKIVIKKNKMIGPEMHVRSIIFDIISYFYFGERYPFSTESRSDAKQLLNLLISYFSLDLTFFQKQKLSLFIHIIQLRIKNRHIINENLCAVSETTQQMYHRQLRTIEQALAPAADLTSEVFKESHYLLTFLFVSEMLELDLQFNKELFSQTQSTAQELLTSLTLHFPVKELQKKELYDSFLKKLLCLSIFRQSYTTFVDTAAYRYFAEVYSSLHRLILRFIRKEHFLSSLELSKNDQAKLYYDIMFTVLSVLEPVQLGKPINIYIDFSHGAAYTEYICQSLQRFRDLNIAVQTRFNNDTQIVLSDYRLRKATCQQIVWKQPPTPSDWAKFADIVIELREKENEKNTLF
ncbi:helix-turn-helix domain-containing protein [Enterococcus sp. DIV0242_7C1]|uniref:Mga helix-turn-helix domain-containing protein n=1 Tax=Candidatus Enterococcus dunnyi TaxID=1834192 RepID=A0A200J7T9_9ENTE|nr:MULTISPECIES: helix-turn-helix domain-containing protein [unclassified Enterococcus]MBO0471534.1 helix-turn-helix domain-containing protein [Enterococcus sp. DIV0242_7C1]OUZ32697.1 hypothetical protein A5889_001406 [Enterococcus sp. 9D6_DIV0238]